MAAGDPKFWTDDSGNIHPLYKESTAEGELKTFEIIVENFNPYKTEVKIEPCDLPYIKCWDEYFIRHVYLAALKSPDPKTKIGAILVRDKNIISTGYNAFARKIQDLPERYNDRELKRRMVCHAEFNSVVTAARLGTRTLETTLYTQGIPCSECCKAVIQGGIIEIVVHKQWPNLTHSPEWVNSIELSKSMLQESGINIRTFDKFLGIEGYLDGKVIKV